MNHNTATASKQRSFLSKIVDRSMENKKPPPAGIEPATFRLTAERSNRWAKEASDTKTILW